MGGMCGPLPGENSVLSFPSFGQTGDYRVGAGELSLRRKRRRRHAEANLRSVLHPALFAEARCDDRFENDLYDVCWKRPLSGRDRNQRPEASSRVFMRRVRTARRAVATVARSEITIN